MMRRTADLMADRITVTLIRRHTTDVVGHVRDALEREDRERGDRPRLTRWVRDGVYHDNQAVPLRSRTYARWAGGSLLIRLDVPATIAASMAGRPLDALVELPGPFRKRTVEDVETVAPGVMDLLDVRLVPDLVRLGDATGANDGGCRWTTD